MANQVTDRITVGIPGERGPIGPRGPEGPEGPRGPEGPAGAGNIDSVNGQTGPAVVLDAADVGAHPAGQIATTSTPGLAALATQSQVNLGTAADRFIAPNTLRGHLSARYEGGGSTVSGLGNGAFIGQTAFLTIGGSFRVQVVWTGVRWESTSWRLSGTTAQRSSFANQGLAYDGIVWFNTSDNTEYVRVGGAWTPRRSNDPVVIERTDDTSRNITTSTMTELAITANSPVEITVNSATVYLFRLSFWKGGSPLIRCGIDLSGATVSDPIEPSWGAVARAPGGSSSWSTEKLKTLQPGTTSVRVMGYRESTGEATMSFVLLQCAPLG